MLFEGNDLVTHKHTEIITTEQWTVPGQSGKFSKK